MTQADYSNKIQQFYNPAVQPLTAAGFLADKRVLSALIIMPLMTVVFIRFVIFLDGAGLNTLKAKLAMWRRQRALNQSHEYAMAMNTAHPNVSNQADNQAAADDDVLAEAAKISTGHVDENVPILLQDLVKTFVDASSGAEIKAVQGVSFEVPVSQVCKAARQNVPRHTLWPCFGRCLTCMQCFGFIGPNGAGKSTTMSLLCGDTLPSSGGPLTSSSNKVAMMHVCRNTFSSRRCSGLRSQRSNGTSQGVAMQWLLPPIRRAFRQFDRAGLEL
jgi:ABC-type multidrug transport system fused ATPase/permease subunit